MKRSFRLFLLIFITTCYLISCSDENRNLSKEVEPIQKNNSNIKSPTKRDSLLMELNICGYADSVGFKQECVLDTLFMTIKEETSLSDAFALMIKYTQYERPILLTHVYHRNSDAELVKLNEYKAILVASEQRGNNKYKDILLRFIEIDEERKFFYNCWFSYSENKSKYVYKECFSINQESTNGYQIDVYSSKEASDRDKIQTNREVEEILNEFGYIN